MFQEIDVNWQVFRWSLALTAVFGIVYALLVRWLDAKKVEGQTAYLVVVGVGVVLLLAGATVGLLIILILFSYFAAAGLPMVIEYVQRVHLQRRKDQEAAKALAKEALDDSQASTR